MQNTVNRFMMLARRWWWLIALGIVLCGGTTYVISKLTHPVYRASATLIVDFQTSTSSNDSVTASLQATSTYAQLLTSPPVLKPVLLQHPGLTLQQLNAMITVTPKPNSQLIELDVENTNPTLAMNLANEISDSFIQYINPQLTASVLPVYAEKPIAPAGPKPLTNAGIGALVGLGLALALIFLFEWVDDRLRGPEDIQDLLDMETLAVIPKLSRRERMQMAENAPLLAEACRMLCAGLNAAQAIRPFKLVMVTSALAGEGKSTIAANLASFLALADKRVLLVDADLRRPAQSRLFQLDNSQGLSGVLAQSHVRLEVEPQSQATDIPTLRVLTAGEPTSHSAELLQSPLANQLFDYFKKAPFDYILFDTPPLLPVADAQFLASRVHATVLVVDASKTPRKVVSRAKSVFSRTHTMILGVAINKSRWPEYGYIREYQRGTGQARRTGARASTPNLQNTDGIPDTSIPSTSFDGIADATTMAIPPLGKEMNPNTPVPPHMDDDEDSDTTITLPRPMRQKPEAGE